MNTVITQLDERRSVLQPRDGFRFGIDALLLAGAVFCRPEDVGCELGTGCGIVPVLLGMHREFARLYAVEIQSDMAALARENAGRNGFDGKIRVIEGDLREAGKIVPEPCDFVLANPPYRRAGRGASDPARFEVCCTVEDLCRAAGEILKGKGRFTVIWPTERLADLFRALDRGGLEPKELIPVVPVRGQAAKLAVVTARKGVRSGLKILPAFVLREPNGRESEACLRLYETGTLKGEA